jgi:hypothetical protein
MEVVRLLFSTTTTITTTFSSCSYSSSSSSEPATGLRIWAVSRVRRKAGGASPRNLQRRGEGCKG